MATFQASILAFVTICAGFVFWVIALGGIGAVTYDCGEHLTSNTCARALQYEWYTVWFELFMLVGLLCLGYSSNFHVYKPALLAFLVLATNSMMWSAHSFMTVGSFASKAVTQNAAAAGMVLLCIVNYLLIWFVGASETPAQIAMTASYTKDTAVNSEP
jgi:hypothetical protein